MTARSYWFAAPNEADALSELVRLIGVFITIMEKNGEV